jgi:hypothetical protein
LGAQLEREGATVDWQARPAFDSRTTTSTS